MSRHTIPLSADRELVVGWDPPLAYFFAQVYDGKFPEDENPRHWVTSPDLDKLARTLRDMGLELPVEQHRALYAEANG